MRQLARTLVLAISFGGLMSGSAEAGSPLEQVPSWSSRSRPLRPAGFIPARPYQSECAAGGRYGALETALAASGAPQPAQDAATAPAEMTKAQLALEPIEQEFWIVYQSLQNKGGIAPDDREAIRSLRDRVTAFNRKWRGEQKGLAFEIQLSVWLEDHDRVDELFERLVKVSPDDPAIGFAWTNYFQSTGDKDRVDEIFQRIVKAYPVLRVRTAWADYLKASNRYGEALAALEGHDLDPTEVPGAVLTFSECLFAEQRYQEALDALEAVPAEVLAENPFLSSQIDRDKPTRQEYVEFWTEEQAIREAEAEADDLPRVELVLDRGRIVVELYENEAPNTVSNFISLVESGFYTDTKFHRVLDFMAQGGDPNTKPGATGVPGRGSPGYRIPDEHGRPNSRRHFTGSLAMTKTAPPNTAGCQFFITNTAPDWLNGKHTVFGHVIEGLEVARGIEQDEVLKSATVLRKRDHEYKPSTLPEEGSTTAPSTQPG